MASCRRSAQRRSPSLMGSFDLWIKALHIVAVISWMAGMLYLPRLFVYHADARAESPISEHVQGHGAAAAQGHRQSGDDRGLDHRAAARLARRLFHVAVAARQTGAGAAVDRAARLFLRAGCAPSPRIANTHSSRFYRFINEVPTAIMILDRLPGGDETVQATAAVAKSAVENLPKPIKRGPSPSTGAPPARGSPRSRRRRPKRTTASTQVSAPVSPLALAERPRPSQCGK